MRAWMRVAVAALATTGIAAGLVPSAATAPDKDDAKIYFGLTSKGLWADLEVRGQKLLRDSVVYGQIVNHCQKGSTKCLKQVWLSDVIDLSPYRTLTFKGDQLSYYRAHKGYFKEWLELRRTQGGNVVSGWLRQWSQPPGYGVGDTGKVSFTTRAWAASAGYPWSGKTADGKPVTMTVGFTSSAHYPLTVVKLSRQLVCGGRPFQVTVPRVEGMLGGAFYMDGKKPAGDVNTDPDAPARGSVTTPDGVAAQAVVAVTKLAPQGKGLVARGTLRLTGTLLDDAGKHPCVPVATTFKAAPR
jgi:hypothetical protein